MSTPLLARRGIHYIATRYGWPALKSAAFDARYQAGAWGTSPEHPAVIGLLNRHSSEKRLCIYGCGTANFLPQMNLDGVRGIWGVDASGRAIEQARRITPTGAFTVGDMRNAVHLDACHFFQESIYYLSLPDQLTLLRRLSGPIIATFHDPVKFAADLQQIRDNFVVEVERDVVTDAGRVVVVFRNNQS